MPTPIGCYCSTTRLELLALILQRDRATFDRLGQVASAFGTPVSGVASTDTCFCSDDRWDMLVRILEQRQANFNRLQQVVEAV